MARPSRGGSSGRSRSSSSRSSSRRSSSRPSSRSSRPMGSGSRASRSSRSYSDRPSRAHGRSTGGFGGFSSNRGRYNGAASHSSDLAEDGWDEYSYEDIYDTRHTVYEVTKSYAGEGCVKMFVAAFIAVALFFIAFILALIVSDKEGVSGIPKSTVKRFKISMAYDFDEDCVYDELDWFSNESSTEKKLKEFYDKTGVQPYIAIIGYSEEFSSAELREAYAKDILYEEMSEHKGSVLYVYFEGENEEAFGYELVVTGSAAKPVIDSEAIKIFWAYLNAYWKKDISTDEVFIFTFNSTAERIMSVTYD